MRMSYTYKFFVVRIGLDQVTGQWELDTNRHILIVGFIDNTSKTVEMISAI